MSAEARNSETNHKTNQNFDQVAFGVGASQSGLVLSDKCWVQKWRETQAKSSYETHFSRSRTYGVKVAQRTRSMNFVLNSFRKVLEPVEFVCSRNGSPL